MDTNTGNFIHDIIDADLASGRVDHVHTRFPPEPNGYLHIGSAKAIWINYSTAKKYGGRFNLRYDDTNPVKEDDEFVNSIYEDLLWLGAVPDGGVFYGSDYFDRCYEFAVRLIRAGKAFVCDLSPEEMREYRGTLTEPGRESPYRNRSIDENLALFERMRAGEFSDGACTLRAKIDMASPNMNMRDPAIYRILHVSHHRQGDKWCIYPMYDFAHPLQDALEGITHSLCSIEFENHRPLYEWVVDNVGGFDPEPMQREFARLNVTYTVMSKRYLRQLVEEKHVDGWDDPRMPTLCALRRRGYTPTSIFEFVRRAGVSKAQSLVDIQLLEHCIRTELNDTAPRRIAVLDPLKVTIEGYGDGVEQFSVPNNPQDEAAGVRELPFTNTLYIERADFSLDPPPKYQRLRIGGEVRLMGAYIIKCERAVQDESGNVTELICSYDKDTGGKNPPDGRKVKGTIHWLSAAHAIGLEAMLYDRLFTIPDLTTIAEGGNYLDYLSPDSLQHVTGAKGEPLLADAQPGDRFQFVRTGYFCKDGKYENTFNRIVTLRDSYKAD